LASEGSIKGATGEIILYQSRPDSPRIGKHGRLVKYETPIGAGMALDMHPFCRESLKDPGVLLFVTEGIKKGDALVSRGLCAVARAEHAKLRKAAGASGQHRRTPGIVADLALGLRYLRLFAHQSGAIDPETARALWARGWRALEEAASEQSQHQAAGESTRRFRELLSAAIASGRAHVANPEGGTPEVPEAWGWRRATVGSGDFEREEWRPQGERIGWLEDEDLYLEPDAALAAVQKQGGDSGEPLAVTGRTLKKRLHERGLLLSTGKEREGPETLTIRHTLEGSRKSVLHMASDLLSVPSSKPDQPDHDAGKAQIYAGNVPPLWSGREREPDHIADHQSPRQASRRGWTGRGQEPRA
jgi:hypothetical protein